MGTARLAHSWPETANADNAATTATRAAPSAGLAHHITSVGGSFSAMADGALVLKDGTTEIQRWHVYDSFAIAFASPIRLTPGLAANLELEASGTGGIVGAVNLTGYTL